MKTFWISFADEKNLGCCIIEAKNSLEAIEKTHLLGINPGGEAMCCEFPDTEGATEEINKWGTNILITPEALMQDGYKSSKDLPEDVLNQIQNHETCTIICKNCNNKLCTCEDYSILKNWHSLRLWEKFKYKKSKN